MGLTTTGGTRCLVALTVGVTLLGVVTFGSLAGSMLPFLLRRLGFDPASASAPFVATLVDVSAASASTSGIAYWFLRGTLLNLSRVAIDSAAAASTRPRTRRLLVAMSACCFGSDLAATQVALENGAALAGVQAWRYGNDRDPAWRLYGAMAAGGQRRTLSTRARRTLPVAFTS